MSAAIPYSMTRVERAVEVARLSAKGLTQRQIVARLGLSRSYVAELLNDPDGSKIAARRRSYEGVCEACGGPTWGGDGKALASKTCKSCFRISHRAKHGTRSRYNAGCSCDDCLRANREYQATLKGKSPPTHSVSGYMNYACRCEKCRDAHLVYMRSKAWEHQRAWRKRQKGRTPPKHGTTLAYGTYGCRCADCTCANTDAARAYRLRKRQAA